MKTTLKPLSQGIVQGAVSCFKNPQRSLGFVVFLVAPSVLVGCGFSLNASSGLTTSQASGQPGPPAEIVPVPTIQQPLTACENPNTGVSNGDWGIGSDPVYVAPWNVLVGTPIYSSNTIFWTSRETAPGQSILLAGAFTDATKKVRIALIPAGTSDWKTVVEQSTTLVSPTQLGPTGLSFIVPIGFAAGVYGFQIEDPSAPPVLGMANVPALNWAIGVPSTTDPATALTHHVTDCAVEPGGTLRIFGKNFLASNEVILQSSSGGIYNLTPSRLDSNSIAAAVPTGLASGTYNLWVGTAPWSATSSPAAQIVIKSALSSNVRNVYCSLVSGEANDNTERLQRCLDQYAPLSGTNEVAYINLPGGGPFVIAGGVTGRPFEVLVGPSSNSTSFLGLPSGSAPPAWFTVPQHFGIVNVSFQAPANPSLLVSVGSSSGNPSTTGHLFFANVNFSSTGPSNGAVVFSLAGPDIQVYNSTFLSNSNQDFDISFGDGAIVSGNLFILNNWTGLAISNSQNVIFENNKRVLPKHLARAQVEPPEVRG